MPDLDDVNDSVWELRAELSELRAALREYAKTAASTPFVACNDLLKRLDELE
jgi:hypothetical protein